MIALDKKNKGFTLIELIIAIGFLVIIMAVVGRVSLAMLQNFNHFNIASERNEHEHRVRLALLSIVRDARASDSIVNVNLSTVTLYATHEINGITNEIEIIYTLLEPNADGKRLLQRNIFLRGTTNAFTAWPIGFVSVPLNSFEVEPDNNINARRLDISLSTGTGVNAIDVNTSVTVDRLP